MNKPYIGKPLKYKTAPGRRQIKTLHWLAYLDENHKRVFLLNSMVGGEPLDATGVKTCADMDSAIALKNEINATRQNLPLFTVCLSTFDELNNLIRYGSLRPPMFKKTGFDE